MTSLSRPLSFSPLQVLSSHMVQRQGRNPSGNAPPPLAECLVGDDTGVVIFTARNDQGDSTAMYSCDVYTIDC